jgi:AcrR family transcriptional regulator
MTGIPFAVKVSLAQRPVRRRVDPARPLGYINDRWVINFMPAAAPRTAPPPRRRRKDARPHELIDAALELFAEKGFTATRSEEVAQRAGVSKGTLYLYYPSKEELFKAVIEHSLGARIADTAQQVQAWRGPVGPLLEDLLVKWWQQAYAGPASCTFKIIVSEVRNFPDIAEFYLHHVIEPGSALIGGIVQRGVASGEFRADTDVENTVHSLVLPMVMLCVHKHGLGACTAHRIDGHRFIAEHVALVVRGLAARPAAARHLESSAPLPPSKSPRPRPR